MADPLLLILYVAHVAVVATAFAVTLPAGGALRRASGQSRDVKAAAATLATRTDALAGFFGVLALVTGLTLILRLGGFSVVAPAIHAGMAIVLVMIAFGALFMRPAGRRIVAAVDQDDSAWTAARKRFAMGDGILQALWLVVLVLMYLKRS